MTIAELFNYLTVAPLTTLRRHPEWDQIRDLAESAALLLVVELERLRKEDGEPSKGGDLVVLEFGAAR